VVREEQGTVTQGDGDGTHRRHTDARRVGSGIPCPARPARVGWYAMSDCSGGSRSRDQDPPRVGGEQLAPLSLGEVGKGLLFAGGAFLGLLGLLQLAVSALGGK
jgi:hypothetical protein